MTEAIKRAEEKAIAALCHPEHPMLQRVTTAILDARNEGRNEGLEEAVRIADKHSQKGFHSWAPGEIAAEIRALKEPT